MKILLVESHLDSFGRKKDGSVKMTFSTLKEMQPDEFGLVDQYYQQNGHLAFKLDEIDVKDIPVENTEIKGQISPSKSLRYSLFALHMKKGGAKEDFTPYYVKVMAGIEQEVRDQIDELED